MQTILTELIINHPALSACLDSIKLAAEALITCYENGGKLLLCGNGGSAADCEHIAGELLKGFAKKRPLPDNLREKFTEAGGGADFIGNLQGALPAISLTGHVSLSTAFANDVNPDFTFAQQLYGLGNPGDVLIAISTSGNAKNVINAVITAKVKDVGTVGLTGWDGGKLAELCDITIKAPADETYRVQEYHLPVYHALCRIVEERFFET